MGYEPWEQGPSLGDSQSPTDLPILCMCSTCKHVLGMKMIQIRNVPDSLQRALKSRAELSEDRAHEALRDLADFPLVRYPHDLLLRRIRGWILRLLPTTPPMWPSPRPWMLYS